MINLVNYTGTGKKHLMMLITIAHQWMYYNYFADRVQNMVLSDRF